MKVSQETVCRNQVTEYCQGSEVVGVKGIVWFSSFPYEFQHPSSELVIFGIWKNLRGLSLHFENQDIFLKCLDQISKAAKNNGCRD